MATPLEPTMVSRVRVNAIANYLGRGWATIIGLLCLPLFLSLLGSEAYGLIGAFVVVQAWALLLDFGLTPTLNREIVRARTGARTWLSLASLVRSIELVVVILAVLLALLVYLLAPLLATAWLQPHQLSARTVTEAISIMGALAAVRWIEQVYRGAIQGSEDQVWLNLVQAGVETARWVGALIVIRFVDTNVLLFFAWNLLVSGISVWLLRRRVGGTLRQNTPQDGSISLKELGAVRGFAGGMFLSSLLTFLLTQADKLIVGSYVTLADFGIYTLAGTAAAGLLQLVQPMNVAVLPRFTALVNAHRHDELVAALHAASEWLSAIVLPIGLLVVVFPQTALLVWTGQPAISAAGAPILSLLMLASLLNAMLNIPYMLQLAHGWTSLTNKVNAAGILLMIPILIWATGREAGVGAAATLAGLNFLSLVITSRLIFSRLMPREFFRWLRGAVIVPSALGVAVAMGMRFAFPAVTTREGALVQLGAAAIAIGLVVLASLRHPRDSARAYLRRRSR